MDGTLLELILFLTATFAAAFVGGSVRSYRFGSSVSAQVI